MQIGLIIAEFDASFTTTFKHAARVRYGVDFDNSSISTTKENLQVLKENIQAGNIKDATKGLNFPITAKDVEHMQILLDTILIAFTDQFKTTPPPNKKLYDLFRQLRDAAAPTPKELAKDIVKEILQPEPPKKLSKKEQIAADAEAFTKNRALKHLTKHTKK